MSKTALSPKMVDTLQAIAAGRAHESHRPTLAALVRRGLVKSATTVERSRYSHRRIVAVSIVATLTDAGRAALA